jgi:hypothetical protein
MDWSDEQKLCFVDRYKHIILCNTCYIAYKKKIEIRMC